MACDSEESFIEIFTYLDNSDKKLLQEMGNRGYNYADRTSRWDRVIDKYISNFQSLIKESNKKISCESEINKDIKIILMYRCIAEGDAVGNDIIREYDTLKNMVIPYIYMQKKVLHLFHILQIMNCLKRREKGLIIYHHANYWEKGEALIKEFKGRVCMRYHNITPHTFFEPYSKKLTDSQKKEENRQKDS
jgi:hypothetical protein